MKATLQILVAVSKAKRRAYSASESLRYIEKNSLATPKRLWPATAVASIKNEKC